MPTMPPVRLSDDFGFDFALRCLLSGVGYGMADSGEVLAVADRVVPGDRDSWFDALSEVAARLESVADADVDRHRRSASEAYLRAANYRYAAFFHVLGTRRPGRAGAAWRAHRHALLRALALREVPAEPFSVAAGDVVVRAWLFRPADPAPGPLPVVLVHNMMTAPLSDVLMTGVDDAVRRGWAAVAFEGPGQGATWFEDGVGPTDDWAPVAAAVTDRVAAFPDIDAGRLVAMGIGDGGYLAAWATAHDPRIAALVCDPGVVRALDGALGQLPGGLQQRWRQVEVGNPLQVADFDTEVASAAANDPEVAFTAAKLVEQWPTASVGTVLARLSGWDLSPVVDAIRCPTWIADPDAAMSFPGQSAELAGRLGGRADLVPFTSAEGAGLDCEIGAPQLRNQRAFDWLEEHLPGPGSAGAA